MHRHHVLSTARLQNPVIAIEVVAVVVGVAMVGGAVGVAVVSGIQEKGQRGSYHRRSSLVPIPATAKNQKLRTRSFGDST